MRIPAQLIALLLVACASSSDVQRFRTTLVPNGFEIMTGTEREVVLTQCSRAAPEAKGFWSPTAADIRALERRLPSYLARQQGNRPSIGTPYYRHYVGVTHDGRRSIYLSAFPVGTAEPDWRRHAQIVCDGGNVFWGVEYDPLTKQFTNLSVNGEA